MTSPAPGRVLRLALVAWGLGDLALGHSVAGVAWLGTEAIAIAALVVTSVLFIDTSWYLLPFMVGVAFLVIWAAQAVLAFRRAQRVQDAVPPTPARSPALGIAWLTLPLLVWGTGFWVVAAASATPDAVMDRFVTGWAQAVTEGGEASAAFYESVSDSPAELAAAATAGLAHLAELCRAGELADDCDAAPENLLRDVRVSIERDASDRAVAVAELVDYVRQPTTILGFIQASELVPVPTETILTAELATTPAALGAVRWTIVNAEAG